jgi:hypothetical protein
MEGAIENTLTIREAATDAIRFWEPRRLIYNGALAVIVIGYFIAYLPESKAFVSVDRALFLFNLAVLANVAYCAAYVVDVFVQASGFRNEWRRMRWVLFAIGLVFASILTRLFVLGLFHSHVS